MREIVGADFLRPVRDEMLVENVALKNAVPLGTECDDFSNGLNCNSCYAEPKSSLALVSLFNPNLTAFGYF
jgi:hypothetical protein